MLSLEETKQFVQAGRFKNVRVVTDCESDRYDWIDFFKEINESYGGSHYTRDVTEASSVIVSRWHDLVILLPGTEPPYDKGVVRMQRIECTGT